MKGRWTGGVDHSPIRVPCTFLLRASENAGPGDEGRRPHSIDAHLGQSPDAVGTDTGRGEGKGANVGRLKKQLQSAAFSTSQAPLPVHPAGRKTGIARQRLPPG